MKKAVVNFHAKIMAYATNQQKISTKDSVCQKSCEDYFLAIYRRCSVKMNFATPFKITINSSVGIMGAFIRSRVVALKKLLARASNSLFLIHNVILSEQLNII